MVGEASTTTAEVGEATTRAEVEEATEAAVGDMEVVVTASEVSRAEAVAVAATETGTEAATAMEGSRAEAAREEARKAHELAQEREREVAATQAREEGQRECVESLTALGLLVGDASNVLTSSHWLLRSMTFCAFPSVHCFS